MAKDKIPTTPAIRMLKQQNVPYTLRTYQYEDRGGTAASAKELNVDEHQVIKTLVMENEKKAPLIILMHGDREVSTKNFARTLGAKTIKPCDPKVAQKHTGYMVGGTSPFGTRKHLRVYMESTIQTLPKIYINAGRRGLLAEMSPKALIATLNPVPVEVAI